MKTKRDQKSGRSYCCVLAVFDLSVLSRRMKIVSGPSGVSGDNFELRAGVMAYVAGQAFERDKIPQGE